MLSKEDDGRIPHGCLEFFLAEREGCTRHHTQRTQHSRYRSPTFRTLSLTRSCAISSESFAAIDFDWAANSQDLEFSQKLLQYYLRKDFYFDFVFYCHTKSGKQSNLIAKVRLYSSRASYADKHLCCGQEENPQFFRI